MNKNIILHKKMSLKKSILFLICIIIGAKITIAQTNGCTDFQAKNFNPNASINDGSCLYNNTSYSPVKIINKLSDTINETSGIINLNGELWTIDDSGNPNAIYHFDKNSGIILQTIYISNAINYDWEEISADANNIYVGDFGNNNGNRTALAVYKISISQLTSKKVDTITAQKISFSYSDQIDFTSQNNATRFDCEAMFIWNDSIHLLSKDWVGGHSKHYVLSTIAGTYAIAPRDSFDAECMITGATFDSSSKRIVLSGYNKTGFCFLWLLWDFTGDKIFSGNKRKIDLGFFTGTGQVEGVCFNDSNNIYLTNENYIVSNKLCAANIGQWVNKKLLELISKNKI